MRHRSAGIKLNRTSSHRKAMFRNMVTSLFKHERIRTTDAKAKEIRRWADKLVTLAKRGDLHARRQALSIIREKDVVHKLFEEAPQRFAQVNGGYTRVVKVGFRPGDAAPISMVELVTPEVKKKKARRKKKAKKAAAPSTAATAVTTPEAQEETTVADASPKTEAETAAETTTSETQAEAADTNVAPAEDDAPVASEAQAEAVDAPPVETAPEEKSDADAPAAEGDATVEETPPKDG